MERSNGRPVCRDRFTSLQILKEDPQNYLVSSRNKTNRLGLLSGCGGWIYRGCCCGCCWWSHPLYCSGWAMMMSRRCYPLKDLSVGSPTNRINPEYHGFTRFTRLVCTLGNDKTNSDQCSNVCSLWTVLIVNVIAHLKCSMFLSCVYKIKLDRKRVLSLE